MKFLQDYKERLAEELRALEQRQRLNFAALSLLIEVLRVDELMKLDGVKFKQFKTAELSRVLRTNFGYDEERQAPEGAERDDILQFKREIKHPSVGDHFSVELQIRQRRLVDANEETSLRTLHERESKDAPAAFLSVIGDGPVFQAAIFSEDGVWYAMNGEDISAYYLLDGDGREYHISEDETASNWGDIILFKGIKPGDPVRLKSNKKTRNALEAFSKAAHHLFHLP